VRKIKSNILNKYLVFINNAGNVYLYFQGRNGIYKEEASFPTPFALEKELGFEIKKYTEKHFKPFIELREGTLYEVSQEWGDVIKTTIRVLESLRELREKLRFLEEVQFFSLLESRDLKTLKEKLATFLLKKKIE